MKDRTKGLDNRASPLKGAVANFDLGSLLGYRLLRLSSSIGNLANRDAHEVAGLTLPEYRVLTVLYSRGPSGVVALQQAMLIDKAWISRTLTGLVATGLVVSAPDPVDARRTAYSVTTKGSHAADALIAKAVQRQKRILKGFDHLETEELMKVLSRIQANVEEVQPKGGTAVPGSRRRTGE